MSYSALHRMKESRGLWERLVSAAAQESILHPESWVNENHWPLVSRSDWLDAWKYAEDTMTVNHNPDIGARDDVLNDGMLLAAIQDVNVA